MSETLEQFCRRFDCKAPQAKPTTHDYSLVTDQLRSTLRQIPAQATSAGLALGRSGTRFTPTPALLTLLATKTNQKAIVNDKGAWLFICGRDILEASITHCADHGDVIILTTRGEAIGWGTVQTKNGKRLIKNRFDIGDYLRREDRTSAWTSNA
ncbi:MAG: hypothetical protein ABIH41_04625 [Nanoarchaeota archaeon]